jgi:hypothetical protein
MKWRSLVTQRPEAPRGDDAKLRLARAYLSVFGQKTEDVELVLADLADFCGFYNVAPPGLSGDQLQYDAGKRASFGRLFSFLSLSDERLAALEKAARAENEANETQGYL